MSQVRATAGPAATPLHRLCRGLAAIGVVILFVCALLTVADILGRRLFEWTVPGMVDLTQLLVMNAVFLWIPYVFERRANVEVDLLFERLPRVARRWLDRSWPLLGAAFLLVAAWYAGRTALQVLEYGDSSQTIGVPMIWYWAPVLFGTVLAAIVCVIQFAQAMADPQAGGSKP